MNPSDVPMSYYYGIENSPIFHNDTRRPYVEYDGYVWVDGEIHKQCFIRKNRTRSLEEVEKLLRKNKKFHMIETERKPYAENTGFPKFVPEIQKVVDDFYTEHHNWWFRTRITLDELQEANTNMNEFHTQFFPDRFIYQNVWDTPKKKITVKRKK